MNAALSQEEEEEEEARRPISYGKAMDHAVKDNL